MKNPIYKLPWYKAPKWLKLFLAKILVRTLTMGDLENDIVLFNELNLWIDTDCRPQTSNINYHINKNKIL